MSGENINHLQTQINDLQRDLQILDIENIVLTKKMEIYVDRIKDNEEHVCIM